jgi:ribonuclease HI
MKEIKINLGIANSVDANERTYVGYCNNIYNNDTLLKSTSSAEKNTTINRMSLKAIIKSLEELQSYQNLDIKIYCRDYLLVNGINHWIKNWKQNNWKNSKRKTVVNVDLWIKYFVLSVNHNIQAFWIRQSDSNNNLEECNKIALTEVTKLKEQIARPIVLLKRRRGLMIIKKTIHNRVQNINYSNDLNQYCIGS